MQGSGGEDQRHPDPLSKSTMEDSTAMTIDFLRARLLSERSVSRTARQRADQLAKRVVELEEQLKVVMAQRKKAERAAVEVIAILKNLGLSDVFEAFDSDSDHEEDDKSESRESNNSMKEEENSVTSKSRKDEAEDRLSSSEVEVSSISGRSLSWKAGKGKSLNSQEKKHLSHPRRRQNSLMLNGGTSPKHQLGKSCRQIKRKDLREASKDVRDLSLDGASVGIGDSSNHFEGRHDISNGDSLDEKDRTFLNNLVLHSPEKQIEENVSFPHGGDCRSEEMDRALEQQAQLIGLYEEEENAQREWEEKYREKNENSLDLCEPGNQLDVPVTPQIEEKRKTVEIQLKEEESYSRPLTDDYVSANSATPQANSSHNSKVTKPGPRSVNQGHTQTKMKEEQYSEVESFTSDSHLLSAGIEKQISPISGTYGPTVQWSGRQKQQTSTRDVTPPSESRGVLEALQLAKLSLNQELHRVSSSNNQGNHQVLALPAPGDAQVTSNPTDVSVGCSSLFRLPTELASKSDALAALPMRPSYSDYGLNKRRGAGSLETGFGVSSSGVHSTSAFVDVARAKVLDNNSYLDSRIMGSELSNTYAALSMPIRMPSFSPYNYLETMSRPMPEGDRFPLYDEKIRPPSTHGRQ